MQPAAFGRETAEQRRVVLRCRIHNNNENADRAVYRIGQHKNSTTATGGTMDSYRAIENLLSRYAELIDAGDLAGLGELFARGSVLAPTGEHGFHGRDEVRGMYEAATRLYEDGTPCTQHNMSNIWIEVDEAAGTAQARLCFTVVQELPDFPLQVIIAGRYRDRFARDENGWYFVERRMLPRMFGDLSRHLLIDVPR
jgi:3-phenylpropionate/cinnamic acid dioxygenase small subunit